MEDESDLMSLMDGGLSDDEELLAELDELEAECVSDRHCQTRKAELSWAVLSWALSRAAPS